MLNLDAIKFEVDTTELTTAVQKLESLRSSVSKLSTPIKQLTKAEKDNADAQLTLAKTADIAAKTAERKAKAQKVLESSTKAATSILQRQSDILSFMAAGYSKGQSGVLAAAKATGQLSKELQDVLVAQRKLQGGDPFDKSQAGVTSLKNQLAELKDEMRATGAGVELTSKQYKELARDKLRLIEAAKQTGKGFAELREQIRNYQAEFIGAAQKVNALTDAEKSRERAAKDRANAIRAVSAEEERMATIVANSADAMHNSVSISEVASRRLANYQRNLRIAGVSQEEITKRLAAYKIQLEQVTAVEQKRRMDHLSRALAPQISDVVVSLGSGMNPMTVLLQQGLQVRDLIGQSGVAAQDLQKAFKTAASDMVSSIRGTIAALGMLTFGALVDAGKAVTMFAGKLPLISHGVDGINKSVATMAAAGVPGMTALGKAIGFVGTAFVALSSFGILALISGFVALMIATGKVISEQTNLSRSLLTTGASLGLTAAGARELAGSLDGISTSKGISVLTEMAKAGGFTQEQFKQIGKAAVDMEKFAGQSIEDTVKQFKDLQKDPVEALAKLAAGNGQVEIATLKRIKQLQDAGKHEQATAEATLAHAAALEAISATAEAELHPMQRLWIDIKSAIGSVWEEIKNLARADAIIVPLKVAFDTVKAVVYDVWMGIKFMGGAIAGIITIAQAFATGGIPAAAAAMKVLKEDFNDGLKKRNDYMKSIMDSYNNKPNPNKTDTKKTSENAKAAESFLRTLKKTKTEGEKADDALQRFANSMKAAEEQAEYFDDSLTDADKALIKIQNSEAWKNGSPGMRKQATEAAQAASAAQRYLAGINAIKAALEKLKSSQTEGALAAYEGSLISSGMDSSLVSYNVSLQKEALDLQDEILKIKNGQATEEQKLQLIEIARQTTIQNLLNLQQQYYNQIEASVQALSKGVAEETELLDFQLASLGLIGKERDRQLKIKQLELEMERELAKAVDETHKARIRNAYEQKIANVDKQISLDYYDKLTDGITDAVVTGLFEGGKAGSKKLRDLVVAELKEPVTIYVKAIVSQLSNWLSGTGGGGGVGDIMTKGASAVYDYYSVGAGKETMIGSGVNAISNYAVASKYGTAYGSQQTSMLLAQEQGMSTAAGGWMSYMGYAALIAAAVMVAQNLYEKGWNRMALGDGGSEQKRFGYTKFNTDPNMGNSWQYDYADPGMSKFRRGVMDKVGFSEKWADIFSGSVRMANLFGRKLGAYGYAAEINNGETTSVGGFARYKGGVLRSNKTVGVDIDSRDAAKLTADIAAVKESARGMAAAMGYSTEAIDNYSGSLKVNFKNATTAEEQAKRYADAMEELHWNMLKGTEGFKMTKEEFQQLRAEALKMGEAAGYSAQTVTDTLIAGMTGRMSQADVGAVLGDQIVGSVYNALAMGFANQITGMITSMIIQPIMTSIMTGGLVSAAVSKKTMDVVLQQAKVAIDYFNQMISDPAFIAFIEDLRGLGSRLASLSVKPAANIQAFGSAALNAGNAAADAARKIKEEREQMESSLMEMLGLTTLIREREIKTIDKSNQALQRLLWTLEDAETAYDDALESAKTLRDNVKSIFDAITEGIKELRNEVESTKDMSTQDAYAMIRSAVQSGKLPEEEALQDAIEAITSSIETADYVSQVEADRARLQAAALLGQLGAIAENDLTALDKQIADSEKSINTLLGIQTNTFNTQQTLQALQTATQNYANAIMAGFNQLKQPLPSAVTTTVASAPVAPTAPVTVVPTSPVSVATLNAGINRKSSSGASITGTTEGDGRVETMLMTMTVAMNKLQRVLSAVQSDTGDSLNVKVVNTSTEAVPVDTTP